MTTSDGDRGCPADRMGYLKWAAPRTPSPEGTLGLPGRPEDALFGYANRWDAHGHLGLEMQTSP
jgi:hypothetical protein